MRALFCDGLLDLQVNGYAGVDFNDPGVTPAAVDRALEAMLESGVTGCLPTLITAAAEDLAVRFRALDAAVSGSRLGPRMVPGYHLEGPFLNDAEGYRGCHPQQAMADPDPRLPARLETGLRRPILLVTLAPERAGGIDAVRRLAADRRLVALGHSAAGFGTVRAAAAAGATLSTHLGNGLPQVLPKLDNTLLAQLAEPGLAACLIADGHHVPPDALAALVRLKGAARTVLVTDAVLAAAAPAGRYAFAGMEVELAADGAVRRPDRPGLAGSALRLDAAVRNAAAWCGLRPEEAVGLAARNPRRLLAPVLAARGVRLDPGTVGWSDALEPRVEKLPDPVN